MDTEERKRYHAILVNMWQAFTADYGLEFSDNYWNEIIAKMDSLRIEYANDEVGKFFADKLSQLFLDVHEKRQERERRQ